MSSFLGSLRNVFGERKLQHKESLLKRSHSTDQFSDTTFSSSPPSSPTRLSSSRHSHSPSFSLLPSSSISIEVITDNEGESNRDNNRHRNVSNIEEEEERKRDNKRPKNTSNKKVHFSNKNNNNNNNFNEMKHNNQLPPIPEAEEEGKEINKGVDGIIQDTTSESTLQEQRFNIEEHRQNEPNIKETYRCKEPTENPYEEIREEEEIEEKDVNEEEAEKEETRNEEEESETKEAPKFVGKRRASLQLTMQGNLPFLRRPQDIFCAKLNKGIDLEGMEPRENKSVVVDVADYEVTVVPFIMAFARALHTCGVPAHRMERVLTIISTCFGIEGNFFYTPTGIFLSFNHPKPVFAKFKHTYMHLVRLPMVDWDMERLHFLEELVDDVIESRVHVSNGVAAINDIMRLPLRYTLFFEIAAVVVLSLGCAVLFGLSWSESRASGLAGVWTGFMLSVGRKHPGYSNINPVISGFGAGIIVTLFGLFVTPVHALLASLASLMYHMPLLSVTISISELVTGNLVAGSTRFVGSLCSILQVGFGSWTGITIVELYAKNETKISAHPEEWYWIFFATFLAAIGNAILSRVPPKLYWVTFVSCALGTLGGQIGAVFVHPTFGAFLGAFLICIFANIYARTTKRGVALIPMWSGMLLLVPATISLNSLANFGDNELLDGTEKMVTMLQNATALALGLFSANAIANPYKAL